MSYSPESLIFVLGCQRSGTTWLANILDSSPDILLFMEPFSIPFNIFPEFPEPSFFLDHSSPHLDHFLQTEFPTRLMQYKTLISKKSLYDPARFQMERRLLRIGRKQERFLTWSGKKDTT